MTSGASAVGPSSAFSGTAEIGTSSVGQRLRRAREARGMSIADVSQALKLGPKQVEALEAENWGALPGNTMIRGFIRNYARLLNLDSEPLMRDLDAAHLERTLQLDVSAGTSATLPQSNRRAQRRDWLAVWGGLLMLALAVLALIAGGMTGLAFAYQTGVSSYGDDVDGLAKRFVAAGGKELRPLTNQFYGDRSGTFEDPEGYKWTLAQHVEDVSPEEMMARMAKMGG